MCEREEEEVVWVKDKEIRHWPQYVYSIRRKFPLVTSELNLTCITITFHRNLPALVLFPIFFEWGFRLLVSVGCCLLQWLWVITASNKETLDVGHYLNQTDKCVSKSAECFKKAGNLWEWSDFFYCSITGVYRYIELRAIYTCWILY